MTTTILSKVGFTKPGVFCANSQNSWADPIAPSVRVPVTVANRAYLKFLRRAELEAWRDARGGTVCVRREDVDWAKAGFERDSENISTCGDD